MDVDAVVIGLGSGGELVAARLAEAGLEVMAVDHDLVGGVPLRRLHAHQARGPRGRPGRRGPAR